MLGPCFVLQYFVSFLVFNHESWGSERESCLLYFRGTKICSIGPGHMTKMVDTPIYGKKTL